MTDRIDIIARKIDMQDGSREIDPFPQGNPKISSSSDSGTVTLSIGGESVTISAPRFYRIFREKILSVSEELEFAKGVLGSVIEKLLNNRDFLCLQLDHAYGNISDKDFEQLAEPFLKEHPEVEFVLLKEKMRILCGSLPHSFDSETISTVFDCSIGQAEQALLSINNEAEDRIGIDD